MSAQVSEQWKQTCYKAIFWLAIEVVLNLLNLDNLADYGEFVFDRRDAWLLSYSPVSSTLVFSDAGTHSQQFM